MVARADVSGNAVRAALSRFRPLAFSASFKLQDMIAEWVLRANGVSDWQFSKKLDAYDRLLGAGHLTSPQLLPSGSPVSSAFWELYRFLVPFRGTVVHSGGVLLQSDGTVSVRKGHQVLHLTPDQQASYMRAMCLLAQILSEQLTETAFLRALIESDLSELAPHHGVSGLAASYSRLAALEVQVPASHIRSPPVAFDIDFGALRGVMARTYSVGNTAKLFLSTTLTATIGPQELTWNIPFEFVPDGVVTIQQGDPQWDRFLSISGLAS